MKDQKNQILEALTTKHIEQINKNKLNSIAGGPGGSICTVMIEP